MKTFSDYEVSAAAAAKIIYKLTNSPKFLRGHYLKKAEEIVIDNQEDAIIFSTDQDVDRVKGVDYKSWSFVIEDADINFGKRTAMQISLGEKGDANLLRLLDEFNCTEKIFKIGGDLGLRPMLLDAIVSDVHHFYVELVFFDSLSGLDKILFAVYKDGGIPCGWKGQYPAGSLLIYNHE